MGARQVHAREETMFTFDTRGWLSKAAPINVQIEKKIIESSVCTPLVLVLLVLPDSRFHAERASLSLDEAGEVLPGARQELALVGLPEQDGLACSQVRAAP